MSVTSPYVPPGVSVTELSSPSVSPLLASPADVCIIGVPTPSNITTTDTVVLGIGGSTTPIPLPTLAQLNNDAVLGTVLSVLNVLNPSVGTPPGTGYVSGVDYTFSAGEAGPDGSAGTITWVNSGSIPEGTLVSVTYTYQPSDYWQPIRFYDIGSVESRFGASWATTTNSSGATVYSGINSQLSMAARLAFINGAQSVICQPLFKRATPGNPSTVAEAATGADVALTSTWSDTLFPLRAIVNLDIIVPIVGVDGVHVSDSTMLAIFETIQGHIAYQNTQELFIVAIMGEDGTSSSGEFLGQIPPANLLRTHAAAMQTNYGNALSSQGVLLNNTVFQLPVPGGQGGNINVGGQYAAASVAGAIASRPVSAAMTRQYISGFASCTDPRTPADKNADAGAGLFVVENYNNLIRCRQGVTLDIHNGPARQELSVVRAKFLLMESIQQTLDNQIIGQIIADANSPLIVQSAITGVLALLQQSESIVGYSPVTAQLSATQPTTITASFSYQPAFPLNYIAVQFTLDLTTGTISTSDTTAGV